jgi:hypothetical protein
VITQDRRSTTLDDSSHATVAFTLDTYTSALPAMDKSAADVVAELILGTEEVRGSRPAR